MFFVKIYELVSAGDEFLPVTSSPAGTYSGKRRGVRNCSTIAPNLLSGTKMSLGVHDLLLGNLVSKIAYVNFICHIHMNL
jgi:hypothetical protein